MNSQEAWQKQSELMAVYKNENPELVECKKRRSEDEIFNEIGIWNMPPNRPDGYIRRFYEDFLVEERTQDDEVVKLDKIAAGLQNEKSEGSNILYANLIKIGLTTNIAIERLTQAFGLKANIGFAGLKDEFAITGQQVSFPRMPLPFAEIEKTKINAIILTNWHYRPKSLRPGYLDGNDFTIVVRTKEKKREEELIARLSTLEKYGFLNYYQSQRFGGVRLESHKIGKLVLQGNYELAVRYLLFKTNEYEMPIIAKLKKQGEKSYPDYTAVIGIFEKMPYSLFNELNVLEYIAR